MRVLVTGANGFVGSRLVRRMLEREQPLGRPVSQLILLDQRFDGTAADPRVVQHAGNFGDLALLGRALADGVDLVFHLASVPGGLAEREYELGRKVNLDGTLTLLEALRTQERPPIVVFASSVAVYGDPLCGCGPCQPRRSPVRGGMGRRVRHDNGKSLRVCGSRQHLSAIPDQRPRPE